MPSVTHFMLLVFFCTTWKHLKTRGFRGYRKRVVEFPQRILKKISQWMHIPSSFGDMGRFLLFLVSNPVEPLLFCSCLQKSQWTRSQIMINTNIIIITIPAIKRTPARIKKFFKVTVYCKLTNPPVLFEK